MLYTNLVIPAVRSKNCEMHAVIFFFAYCRRIMQRNRLTRKCILWCSWDSDTDAELTQKIYVIQFQCFPTQQYLVENLTSYTRIMIIFTVFCWLKYLYVVKFSSNYEIKYNKQPLKLLPSWSSIMNITTQYSLVLILLLLLFYACVCLLYTPTQSKKWMHHFRYKFLYCPFMLENLRQKVVYLNLL